MWTALMLTSNEHSVMFRMMTNGDLCNILRSFVTFLPHESQENGRQYNVTECNTLPVLYNINVSTVISPHHQDYIYIYP